LLGEISVIKHLLFCRLLLGHATLLPAALRANNVQDFLAEEEVTSSSLRDICLKMENPGLQEIRDACADLFRPEEESDDSEPDPSRSEKPKDEYDIMMLKHNKKHGHLPD
jgi:hypothetical protein